MIQLRKIDPKTAVLTINSFFGSSDAKDASADGIKVDADPVTMKLYVRATARDLEQVKTLIEKLEGPGEGGVAGSTLRFIPMTGNSAVNAVEMAERLWRGPNQIRMTAPSDTGPGIFDLREISPEVPAGGPTPPAKPPATRTKQTATEPAPRKPVDEPKPEKVALGTATTQLDEVVPVHFVSLHPEDAAFRWDLAQDPLQEPTPTEQVPPAEATEEPAPEPAPSPQATPAEPTLPAAAEGQATPSENAPEPPAAVTPADLPGQGSDIHIEFTANGILISSDDTQALDKFEEILRTVAGPQVLTPGKNFTVYFLKHCKADVARQLISDILGGTTSESGGGSLVGDMASNLMGGGGGILGAILGGGGGGGGGAVTTVQATGPVSIVSDTRLNCLVVQALPVDVQLIEQLLKVIDREGSITDVFTAGKPHIIPVNFVQVEEVASIVREAFASRIAGACRPGGWSTQPGGLHPSSPRRPRRRE